MVLRSHTIFPALRRLRYPSRDTDRYPGVFASDSTVCATELPVHPEQRNRCRESKSRWIARRGCRYMQPFRERQVHARSLPASPLKLLLIPHSSSIPCSIYRSIPLLAMPCIPPPSPPYLMRGLMRVGEGYVKALGFQGDDVRRSDPQHPLQCHTLRTTPTFHLAYFKAYPYLKSIFFLLSNLYETSIQRS